MRRSLIVWLCLPSLILCQQKPKSKYHETFVIPQMVWSFPGAATYYKHELVRSGGLMVDVRAGANYSVYPVENCGTRRIAFVLQIQPDRASSKNLQELERNTCTISFSIDDGHVEVWFGFCRSRIGHALRKFDFPLNPEHLLYFAFDGLRVSVYKRDEQGRDRLMGVIAHTSAVKEFREIQKFMIFLYHDACPRVNLKQVSREVEWRHAVAEEEEEEEEGGEKIAGSLVSSPSAWLFWRLVTLAVFPAALLSLFLSTIYLWAIDCPFFMNPMYEALFEDKEAKEKKREAAKKKAEEKAARAIEENSCKTAEDKSEDSQFVEVVFGSNSPLVAPKGYALRDFDKPYSKDDDDPGMRTACDAGAVADEQQALLQPDAVDSTIIKEPPQPPPQTPGAAAAATAPAAPAPDVAAVAAAAVAAVAAAKKGAKVVAKMPGKEKKKKTKSKTKKAGGTSSRSSIQRPVTVAAATAAAATVAAPATAAAPAAPATAAASAAPAATKPV